MSRRRENDMMAESARQGESAQMSEADQHPPPPESGASTPGTFMTLSQGSRTPATLPTPTHRENDGVVKQVHVQKFLNRPLTPNIHSQSASGLHDHSLDPDAPIVHITPMNHGLDTGIRDGAAQQDSSNYSSSEGLIGASVGKRVHSYDSMGERASKSPTATGKLKQGTYKKVNEPAKVELSKPLGSNSVDDDGSFEGRKGREEEEDDYGRANDSIDDDDYNALSVRLSESIMSGGSFSLSASMNGGEHQYSTLPRSIFHLFKSNVGAGVFLLPTYYQDAGYAVGALLVAFIGIMTVDCALALIKAKSYIGRSDCKTYPAVVEYILGTEFMHFIRFSLLFTQFGFCVIYLEYSSSLFADLFPFAYSYYIFVLLGVLAVTPMTFLSNRMALLAYISLIAGVFVFTVLLSTAFVGAKDLSTNGPGPGVRAFVPTMEIIVFLSGHLFSLEGIGVVLPVENSIAPADKPKFPFLIICVLSSVVVMYIGFGLLGYTAYGDNLHTSVVLALPSGFAKKMCQILLGLSLILGYPIVYVPAIQIVDKALQVQCDDWKARGVRFSLNAFFGLLAAFVGGDTINIFASFLGAFAGVHLMITIPALLALQLDNALEGHQLSLDRWDYFKLIFTDRLTLGRARWFLYLAFAIFIWFGGTYYTFLSVFVPQNTPTSPPQ